MGSKKIKVLITTSPNKLKIQIKVYKILHYKIIRSKVAQVVRWTLKVYYKDKINDCEI